MHDVRVDHGSQRQLLQVRQLRQHVGVRVARRTGSDGCRAGREARPPASRSTCHARLTLCCPRLGLARRSTPAPPGRPPSRPRTTCGAHQDVAVEVQVVVERQALQGEQAAQRERQAAGHPHPHERRRQQQQQPEQDRARGRPTSRDRASGRGRRRRARPSRRRRPPIRELPRSASVAPWQLTN